MRGCSVNSARMRSAAIAVPIIAATAGLTGCSVTPGAVAGLTKDVAGNTMAIVTVCRGCLDWLTIYSGEDGRDDGSWQHNGQLTGSAQFLLSAPGAEWMVVAPLRPFEAGREYSLHGWTDADEWAATGPSFTTKTLAALEPGHVVIQGEEGATELSMQDFAAVACKSL
jgi:hypothetical protein